MTTGTKPAKRKITGVLIDATNRSVTDVEFEPTLEEMYRLIGCELIEAIRRGPFAPDTLYVDEEGLYKKHVAGFAIGVSQTIVGNGLIVGGPDRHGDETSSICNADDIVLIVTFFEIEQQEKAA
jgi:hypothetical protein